MARIDSYTVITPSPDDYLLGTDSPDGGGPTRNFTVQSIIDLVDEEASGNTNDYLDGITVESGYAADASDTATITFSVGSQTDVTLDLGGAAFKAASHYATASALTTHINDTTNPHSLDSIVGNQTLAPTKLKGITSNGTNGQLISVDGSGNFSYVDDTDANDNYYLSSIQKTGNTVEFVVTGNTNVTTDIFKEAAFLTKAEIRTDVKNNVTFTTNNFTDLKALSKLDKVTVNEIQNLAVTNEKIAEGTINESKLNVTNSPTSGYVLTAGTETGTMTWAANSASNYYLDGISKTGNKLIFSINGGTDVPYTFGGAAFADIGTTSNDVAAGNHNHSISSLTGAGGLATKNSVNTSEIVNKAVTAGKLSPATAGTNGQVLSLNSSGDLVWINSSGTSIADVRLLPSTIGDANADANDGYGGQVLRVNSAGTLVEYVDLKVEKNELKTGNLPAAGKVLGLDTNNDLQWIETPTPTIAADSVTADKIDFIDDSVSATTAGHMLISDGTDFGNVAMTGDAIVTSSGEVKLVIDDIPLASGHIDPTTKIPIAHYDPGTIFMGDAAVRTKHLTISGLAAILTGSGGDGSIVQDNYQTNFGTVNHTGFKVADNGITHAKLENRYTAEASLTTAAAISVNCSAAVNFKLSADLSAATTFTLSNFKVGHTITIWNIKGNQTVNLDAITTGGTPTFYKVGSVNYEDNGTDYNLIEIECIDDDADTPSFMYRIQTYSSDKDDI